jgi:hypothetical protein
LRRSNIQLRVSTFPPGTFEAGSPIPEGPQYIA